MSWGDDHRRSGACVVAAIAFAAGCGRIGFDPAADGGAIPGGINLESTIEMIGGASLASDTAVEVDFDRTQTALATTDYNGDVSYFVEIVATNTDTADHDVVLIDGNSVVVATVTVPQMTTSPTRIRTQFAPVTASTVYIIGVTPTPAEGLDLSVLEARLVVRQVGATKTRLYFPLMTSPQDIVDTKNLPSDGYGSFTVADVYTQGDMPIDFSQWHKDVAQFATLATATPWTFDALVSSRSLGHTVVASLLDATTGAIVTAVSIATDGTMNAI